LLVISDQSVQLVHGDGTIQALADFGPGALSYTVYAKTATSLAIANSNISDPKNKTVSVLLFDRAGRRRWERSLGSGFVEAPLSGILSDETVVYDTYPKTTQIGPSGEKLITTGARTVFVADNWVLLEYEDSPAGQLPRRVHYEWRDPGTNAKVTIEPGWVHRTGRMFARDPGMVSLFSAGSAAAGATLSLLNGAESVTYDYTDGGGDLLFGAYSPVSGASTPRVWRVARDFSSAALLELGASVVETPVLRGNSEMISVTRDGSSFQPVWSKDLGKTFSSIGMPVSGESGGNVLVRGKTAIVTILEGSSFVPPHVLQIFYGDRSVPEVIRTSEFPRSAFDASSLGLSPDGECFAYFEQIAVGDAWSDTWQLVIRRLRDGRENRPSIRIDTPPRWRGIPVLEWWE
jgi:hypothetical protein